MDQKCKISGHCIFPSRVSGRGYKIGPVCLCVCQLVSSLTAEPFNLGSRNWAQRLTLMIPWPSLMVKVIGQRSRSPFWKTWFSDFFFTVWRLDIIWWLLNKNTDKKGTSREGASTLRRFHTSYFQKNPLWYYESWLSRNVANVAKLLNQNRLDKRFRIWCTTWCQWTSKKADQWRQKTV